METGPTHLETLVSSNSIHHRHTPTLDQSKASYYSNSPPSTFQPSPPSNHSFQRATSHPNSSSATLSPPEYEIRSPTRQDAPFFAHTTMFEASPAPPSSSPNTYTTQQFGLFTNQPGIPGTNQTPGMQMMNGNLELKPGMELKGGVQSPHPFYTHSSLPTLHDQLPPSSPNHRSPITPMGIPNMPYSAGYRPYPQVNDIFAPPKQEYFMQSPFYPGYPNYW